MPLPAGIGRFPPFGRFVFLVLHGDLPVLVTQTADFKMFCNVDRNGSYDIKITAL